MKWQAQFKVLTNAVKRHGRLPEIAFFDEAGSPINLGGSGASVQVGDDNFGAPLGKTGDKLAALNPADYWGESEEIPYAPATHVGTAWNTQDIPLAVREFVDPTVVQFDGYGNGQFVGSETSHDDADATVIDVGFDFPWRDQVQREWLISESLLICVPIESQREAWQNFSSFSKLDPPYAEEGYPGPAPVLRSANVISAGGIRDYGEPGATVSYETLGDAPNQVFVVEWLTPISEVPGEYDFSTGRHARVQLHLHEDGTVELHFAEITGPVNTEIIITAGLIYNPGYGTSDPDPSAEHLVAVVDGTSIEGVTGAPTLALNGQAVRLAAPDPSVVGLPAPLPLDQWWSSEEIDFNWIELDSPIVLGVDDFGGQLDDGASILLDPGFDLIFGNGGIQRKWVASTDGTLFAWDEDAAGSLYDPSNLNAPYNETLAELAVEYLPSMRHGISIFSADLAMPSYVQSVIPTQWTGIRHQTIGIAPRRIWVVEYALPYLNQDADLSEVNSSAFKAGGNYVRAQVQFHEIDGSVEVHYDAFSAPAGEGPDDGPGPTIGIFSTSQNEANNNSHVEVFLGELNGHTYNYGTGTGDNESGIPFPEQSAVRYVPEIGVVEEVPASSPINDVSKLELPCAFPFGPSGRTSDWWVGAEFKLVAKPNEPADSFPNWPNPSYSGNHLSLSAQNEYAMWGISATGYNTNYPNVRWLVIGNAPQRILVVEWADYSNLESDRVQVHIHEKDGVVEWHFIAASESGGWVGTDGLSVGIWWDPVDAPLDPGNALETPLTRAVVYDRDGENELALDYVVGMAEFFTEKSYRLTPADVFTSRGKYALPSGVVALKDVGDSALPTPHNGLFLIVRDGALFLVLADGTEVKVLLDA